MERICRVCHKSKNTPYKDICRNCYQKQWTTTIPEKTCKKCRKTFRTVGNVCGPCPGQRLQEKLEWCKHFLLEYGYSVTDPRGTNWEVTNPEIII